MNNKPTPANAESVMNNKLKLANADVKECNEQKTTLPTQAWKSVMSNKPTLANTDKKEHHTKLPWDVSASQPSPGSAHAPHHHHASHNTPTQGPETVKASKTRRVRGSKYCKADSTTPATTTSLPSLALVSQNCAPVRPAAKHVAGMPITHDNLRRQFRLVETSMARTLFWQPLCREPEFPSEWLKKVQVRSVQDNICVLSKAHMHS